MLLMLKLLGVVRHTALATSGAAVEIERVSGGAVSVEGCGLGQVDQWQGRGLLAWQEAKVLGAVWPQGPAV